MPVSVPGNPAPASPRQVQGPVRFDAGVLGHGDAGGSGGPGAVMEQPPLGFGAPAMGHLGSYGLPGLGMPPAGQGYGAGSPTPPVGGLGFGSAGWGAMLPGGGAGVPGAPGMPAPGGSPMPFAWPPLSPGSPPPPCHGGGGGTPFGGGHPAMPIGGGSPYPGGGGGGGGGPPPPGGPQGGFTPFGPLAPPPGLPMSPFGAPGLPGFPGPGGGGGGGGSPDPYISGRWAGAIRGDRKRQAPEIYWAVRGSGAASCREFMTLYYPGKRNDQEWTDLWCLAQSADVRLHQGYMMGGFPEICRLLAEDDLLESWLTRLSAQFTYLRTGEKEMLVQLQATRAPGHEDLAPAWAVTAASDRAQALFRQAGRVNRNPDQAHADDDDAGLYRRKPRRKPKGDGKGDKSKPPGGGPKSGAPAKA